MSPKQKAEARSIVVLAEGKTERQGLESFLTNWLNGKNLAKRPAVRVYNLKGSGNFTRDLAGKVTNHLESQYAAFVFGLLDLFNLPEDLRGNGSVEERLCFAKKQIKVALPDVANEKFAVHFAVHETEAWLLSDSNLFPRDIQAQISKWSANPEKINLTNPPSKRLNQLFLKHVNRYYDKPGMARKLFPRLDPSLAASKCHHLQLFLDDLLAKAQSIAGATP